MVYSSKEIKGFDFVQFYVGNAKHSAFYYARLFGFKVMGYRGPETGERDTASYLLMQNDLVFVITAALVPNHPVQQFVMKHGDGIGEITLRVSDPVAALMFATANGAEVAHEPEEIFERFGTFKRASIKIYGDTILTYINRDGYSGILPGFEAYTGPQFAGENPNLLAIDHIVGNVADGEMDRWARFFELSLDMETFVHFDEGDISTQYSALHSKVVRSKNDTVKFPINEPAAGLRKSQIDEYLEVNRGPGVQHVAIATDNIIHTVKTLRENGVTFIDTPDSYYETIQPRTYQMKESLEDLRRLGILFDNEGDGYLLQLFTQPQGDRPTLFFEFIQRRGSDGFGQNNFQSLFESIEREQARRGNL